MYRCNRCHKSYNDERRYNSHVQRCSHRDINDDSQSIISNRSNIYMNTDKDIKQESQLDIEKLKREIKKYTRELRRVKEENRDDIEKSQEYLNGQISSLIDERDQLSRDLVVTKDRLYTEKDRLRDEFNRKLRVHKEQLEKRYSSENNRTIKRLTTIVNKLQMKLDNSLEQKEKIKEDLEDHYSRREEELRKEISELQEDMQSTIDAFDKERGNLKTIIDSCNADKTSFEVSCEARKNKDIKNILTQKQTDISLLEGLNSSLKKRLSTIEDDKNQEIQRIKTAHTNKIAMKDAQIKTMNNNFNDTLHKTVSSLQCKIDIANNQVEKAVKEATEKNQEMLNIEKSQHNKIVEALKVQHNLYTKKIKNDLKRAIDEAEFQKKYTDKALKCKEEEMVKQFQIITNNLEVEKESVQRTAKHKYDEDISLRNNTIYKLEDELQIIGKELSRFRISNKRIKDDANKDIEEHKNKLDIHKKELNDIIKDKDKTIIDLSNKIKTLEIQLSSVKNGYDSTKQDLTSSLDNQRAINEKINQDIMNVNKKYIKTVREYESRIDDINQKHNNNTESIKKDMSTEFKNMKTKLEKEISTLKSTCNNIKQNAVVNLNTELEKARVESTSKINDIQLELDRKNNEIKSLRLGFSNELNKQQQLFYKQLDNHKEEDIKKLNEAIKSKDNTIASMQKDFSQSINNQKITLMNNNFSEINRLTALLTAKDNEIALLAKDKSIELSMLKRDLDSKLNMSITERDNIKKERDDIRKEMDVIKKEKPQNYDEKIIDIKSQIAATKMLFSKKLDNQTKKHEDDIKEKVMIIEKLKSQLQNKGVSK